MSANGITEPRREAKSLLVLALGNDQIFLIANPTYCLTEPEYKVFWKFVKRRANREPFQHIAGKQEFWGRNFCVTPEVLVPRPETEMIVDRTLKLFQPDSTIEICEIGIGSGCISISLLKELPLALAYGFDISKNALSVAGRNAEKHGVGQRLRLGVSDVFQSIERYGFDLIVSNPPYVPLTEISGLQAEVRDFDPLEALTDGKDGLSIIRRIIDGAPKYLKPGGYLIMEIGFNQSETVKEMFDLEVWNSPDLLPDLQGIPRLVSAKTAIDKDFNSCSD